MKKKLLIILTVLCTAVVTVSACNNKSENETETVDVVEATEDVNTTKSDVTKNAETDLKESTDTKESSTDNMETTAEEINGEIYDTGNFNVNVPENWNVVVPTDYATGSDEGGNSSPDESYIYLSKEAADTSSIFEKPSVQIEYFSPDDVLFSTRDAYDDVSDIDINADVEGVEVVEAIQGKSTQDNRVFQIVQLQKGDSRFLVTVTTNIDGEDTGLSFDNPEVMAIVNSIVEE